MLINPRERKLFTGGMITEGDCVHCGRVLLALGKVYRHLPGVDIAPCLEKEQAVNYVVDGPV